jgi:RecQ mediated genome instability protein
MSNSDRLSQLRWKYGLRNVKDDWLRQNSHYSLENLVDQIARRDLREISTGTLPFAISGAHGVDLAEPVLLQVEDVINISADDPRGKALSHTTLLVSFTDGRQSVAGVELLPLGGHLSVGTIPGTKVRLDRGTLIRRGRVMLTPTCVQVIGRVGPSGNVWGDDYDRQVARAMKTAGYKAAGTTTFDSILENATGDANTPLTGLGGIANIDDDDDDDDAFWIQAMAAEENRVSTAPTATGADPQGHSTTLD